MTKVVDVTLLQTIAGHSLLLEVAVAGGMRSAALKSWLNRDRICQPLGWFAMATSESKTEPKVELERTLILVRAAQDGDGNAFRELVEENQQLIALQMRRFSRDLGVLEELTHDVFVEAYFSLKSFRSDSPFIHWLRRIAVRVGYRYWKNRQKDLQHQRFTHEQLQILVACLDSEPYEAQEVAELVHALLAQLAPSDRLVLTVLYLDGCTMKEAAQRCGWTVTGTKLRAFRARRRLAVLWESCLK